MPYLSNPGPDGWQIARSAPPLPEGHAHVWRFSLDRSPAELGLWTEQLSEDEKKRAARFAFPGLRERFAAGRGLLRILLADYLDLPGHEIAFSYNGHGKPELAGAATQRGIHFNLSHSGGLGLLAVCAGRPVGVDIEAIRDNVKCEDLAERFFSPGEAAELRSLPRVDRRAAFFQCWTRKEAYIKAIGRGLSMPLDGFDVSLRPAQPAQLLAVREDPAEVDRWQVAAITPAPGYAAAVIVGRPVLGSWFGAWPDPVEV